MYRFVRRSFLARSFLAIILILPAVPAAAQTAPNPSPETIALAQQLLMKMAGDPAATIRQLSGPMVGMMQQIGITDPDQARVIVQEALIPVLSDHFNDLIAIWAKAYASALSVDDMKAAIAFYDLPAGQDMLRAGPQLAQAKMVGLTQWMGTLQPEMQQRIEQALKAHGWSKD